MPAKPRRRRADAEQNRAAILAVALEALTESADISLNAVAKRAGVANATLYRHFPTREDLILGGLPARGRSTHTSRRRPHREGRAGRCVGAVGRPARTVRDDQTRPRGCASRGE